MIQSFRSRLQGLAGDRWWGALIVLLVAYLNYSVLGMSGLLQPRPLGHELNQLVRYALLINNFLVSFDAVGLFLPLYLGCVAVRGDRLSGQLYLTLVANPRRMRYLLGTWLALAAALTLVLAAAVANYWVLAWLLQIRTVVSDFVVVVRDTMANMLIVLTVTFALGSAGTAMSGLLGGLFFLSLHNLGAYQTLPFMSGRMVQLPYLLRQWLVTIAPLNHVHAPSLTSTGLVRRHLLANLVTDSTVQWQLAFGVLVLVLAVAWFEFRDV